MRKCKNKKKIDICDAYESNFIFINPGVGILWKKLQMLKILRSDYYYHTGIHFRRSFADIVLIS